VDHYKKVPVVVFDEAHNLEDIATIYFGQSVSTTQLSDFVQDAEKEIKRKKGKFKGIEKVLTAVLHGEPCPGGCKNYLKVVTAALFYKIKFWI